MLSVQFMHNIAGLYQWTALQSHINKSDIANKSLLNRPQHLSWFLFHIQSTLFFIIVIFEKAFHSALAVLASVSPPRGAYPPPASAGHGTATLSSPTKTTLHSTGSFLALPEQTRIWEESNISLLRFQGTRQIGTVPDYNLSNPI